MQENRIAVVGIIVEEPDSAEKVNAALHEFAPFVIGRMGLPYREKGISVISIVIDAPVAKINALTGKLGMISGVSAKALFSAK